MTIVFPYLKQAYGEQKKRWILEISIFSKTNHVHITARIFSTVNLTLSVWPSWFNSMFATVWQKLRNKSNDVLRKKKAMK